MSILSQADLADAIATGAPASSTCHEAVGAILALDEASAGERQVSTEESAFFTSEPIKQAQAGRDFAIGLVIDWHPP